MKNLIVVSAPSGAGKTTLCRRLVDEYSHFAHSISTTTRPIRHYEKNGEHYFFVNTEQFQEKIKNEAFVEWEQVYDYFYGTEKSKIEEILKNGKIPVLDIDVKGAYSIKKIFPDALLVFISPPSLDELQKRLCSRKSETQEVIDRRLSEAKIEMEAAKNFDVILVNEDLEKCYQDFLNLVLSNTRKN